MKAIQIHRFGDSSVLAVDEVQDAPPGRGEVQVRICAAACNPKDVMVRKGRFKMFTGRKFPLRLGHDFAGVVEAVGEGVADLKPGHRVYGMINAWTAGAYAECINVPASEIALMPEGLTMKQAAAIPLAAQTALQALRELGRLKPGHRVCINGASGGVGTFAVQIAKAAGAHVTTITSARNRLLCHQLGADVTLDYNRDAVLNPATHMAPFDIFFDVFGNRSLGAVKPVLAPRAVYIHTIPSLKTALMHVFTRLFPRRGAIVVVKSQRPDLDLLTRMVQADQIRPVIDQTFKLADVARAHEHLETRRARGKVVLTVGEE